jgi:ubiquinone/menaquinone biosynthesis C-methylase UbiE
MTTEYSLDEIERFDREWTDRFAKDCGWEAHVLKDPVDDLNVFFGNLTGSHILDVGCGWGRYVYRFLNQGLVYQGIDHSSEMLKVANDVNPEASFLEGSFRSLPFPTDHFDGLWSCCSLAAVPKVHLVAILQEYLRVLKPGGVMMLVMPFLQYSDEEMYTDDDGKPSIYQAHYYLDEFVEYVTRSGFEILESAYRFTSGSMFVLVRKPN